MKLSLKKISFGLVKRQILYFWIRHYKVLFAVSFFILTGLIAYQWNRDLYRYQWTADERKAYLETTAKETAFQEKKFLGVIERLDQDREQHESPLEESRNFFTGDRKSGNVP